MRPVTLFQAPNYHPYVCIRCGVGAGPTRSYFIDLGVPLSGHFNPMLDGSIYYCNDCVSNLITDINREVAKWHMDHSPWESPDRVEASYSWQQEMDLSGIEQEIEQRHLREGDRESAGDNSDSESISESNDSSDDPNAETVRVPESAVSTVHANADLGLDFGGDS